MHLGPRKIPAEIGETLLLKKDGDRAYFVSVAYSMTRPVPVVLGTTIHITMDDQRQIGFIAEAGDQIGIEFFGRDKQTLHQFGAGTCVSVLSVPPYHLGRQRINTFSS